MPNVTPHTVSVNSDLIDFVTVVTSVDSPTPRPQTKRFLADGTVISHQKAKWVRSRRVPVSGLADIARVLDGLGEFDCIVLDELLPEVDPARHRRLFKERTDTSENIDGDPVEVTTPPSYDHARHQYLVIDFDGEVAEGEHEFAWLNFMDVGTLPDSVTAALPPELRGVECHWRLTSSAGIKPGPRLRLVYWLDRAISTLEMTAWLEPYGIDTSICRAPNQPCYAATPIFDEGAHDPIAEWGLPRSGMVKGFRRMVTVPEITVPERTYQAVPEGLTEDDNDPVLVAAAVGIIGRVKSDGAEPLGKRTWDLAKRLGDMRINGKILSDAGIVKLLIEHWRPCSGAEKVEDLVRRAMDNRDEPRGSKPVDENGLPSITYP
jgi:hypothetical protein